MKPLSKAFALAVLALIFSTLGAEAPPNPVATPVWPAPDEAPLKAARFAINGNAAAVADAVYGFRVIDISNPALLHTVGGVRTHWSPTAVASAGNVAAVLDASAGRVTLLSIA